MVKGILLFGVSVMLLPFLLMLFVLWAKVPPAKPENLVHIQGKIEKARLSEKTGDIYLRMVDDEHHYYINQDLTPMVDQAALEVALAQGEAIELVYFKTRWNPLDPQGVSRPVAAIHTLADPILDLKLVAAHRIH